jgi:flagellar basal-body rod modification protein FlgD
MTGHGMKMNAAAQTRPADTLFTTILRRGIDVTARPDPTVALGSGDIPLIANDDAKKEGEEELSDVCTLLMQLMAMNAGGRTEGSGTEDADEKSQNGIFSVLGGLTDVTDDAATNGLENAVTVILDNGGKATEVLSVLAATGEKAVQGEASTAGASFETALTGITEALKNELAGDALPDGAENAAAENGNTAAFTVMEDSDTGTMEARKQTAMRDRPLDPADSAAGTAGMAKAGIASSGSDNSGNSDGKGKSGFSALVSREESRNDAPGAAESSAYQMVSAAGTAEVTAAEKTTAVEKALSSFADDLRNIRGGSQEIQIVLEPESLGVLTISVIKTESGISAKIKSEDKEVAAIISSRSISLLPPWRAKASRSVTLMCLIVWPSKTRVLRSTGFRSRETRQKDKRCRPGTVPAKTHRIQKFGSHFMTAKQGAIPRWTTVSASIKRIIRGEADASQFVSSNDMPVYERDTSNDPKGTKVSTEMFLKLLVAQLKYQDPLEPQKDTACVTQMAQMTSLQEMQQMNSTLQNSQAYDMVGKEIYAEVYNKETGETTEHSGVVDSVVIIKGIPYVVVENQAILVSGCQAGICAFG